ncbi:MAG: hypothetical protein HQL02_10580 [Nitrospirae bacterium]|nr:hypothetical protein [Nitrospirota bacterium]
MTFKAITMTLQSSVQLRLKTNLLIRSGEGGEFTDSTVEVTPDIQGRRMLHVNGYVWSSLLRRAISRIDGTGDIVRDIAGDHDDNKRHNDSKAGTTGVSSLWCEASFVELVTTDTRPGIKIDRQQSSASVGALYSDEVVPPGYVLTLNFNYFCADNDRCEQIKKLLPGALWVINEGIENIGGGWSYGYGKVEVVCARCRVLDLRVRDDRGLLWRFEEPGTINYSEVSLSRPKLSKGWIRYVVKAAVLRGQLLAIHMGYPLSGAYKDYIGRDLPDNFVFMRNIVGDGGFSPQYVIPGKAIRQALLSVPIERRLRSRGVDICDTPSKVCTCEVCLDYRKQTRQKGNSPDCLCLRCMWFGGTDKGGIISVSDAVVSGAHTVTLKRITLCEHSMQNM